MKSDSVNVAGSLVRMAGAFEREATGWADYPRVASRCHNTVDQLTDVARHVIRTDDRDRGRAWLDAAGLILTHLQLTRRFRDGTAWQKLD